MIFIYPLPPTLFLWLKAPFSHESTNIKDPSTNLTFPLPTNSCITWTKTKQILENTIYLSKSKCNDEKLWGKKIHISPKFKSPENYPQVEQNPPSIKNGNYHEEIETSNFTNLKWATEVAFHKPQIEILTIDPWIRFFPCHAICYTHKKNNQRRTSWWRWWGWRVANLR